VDAETVGGVAATTAVVDAVGPPHDGRLVASSDSKRSSEQDESALRCWLRLFPGATLPPTPTPEDDDDEAYDDSRWWPAPAPAPGTDPVVPAVGTEPLPVPGHESSMSASTPSSVDDENWGVSEPAAYRACKRKPFFNTML